MQFNQTRFKLSITRKVVFAMFLVVLPAMLIIIHYSFTKSKELSILQLEQEILAKAENVEITVAALLEQKGGIVRQLSSIPIIESFLSETVPEIEIIHNDDFHLLKKALNTAKENNEDIELIWLANIKNNYMIANDNRILDTPFNANTRPWFNNAVEKEGLSYSPPYVDYVTNKAIISITHPVTVDNNRLGLLGVDIDLDELSLQLNALETEDFHLILLSSEEQILYDSQNMWNILRKGENQNKDSLRLQANDDFYYSTVREVGELGWQVVVYIPEKIMLAPFLEYEKQLRYAWATMLILLLTILSLVLHYYLKDIPTIVQHINKIERGQFDINIGIQRRDEVGEIATAVEDMAIQIKSQIRELDYLANHDSLTNLLNRNSIEQILLKSIEEIDTNDEMLAVMFLDLDHFKQVNDSRGHTIGDELLIQVSRRIEGKLPNNCFFGRFGGDEFIILCRGKRDSKNKMHFTLQKIQESFSTPFNLFGEIVHSTPSIGVALFPSDANKKKELLINADTALYHAKENGRNQVCFFTPEMKALFDREHMLKRDLRTALLNNEFSLHYQPQLNLKNDSVTSAEALIRWKHPIWGMISPAEFIPHAESISLIGDIGDWVIDTSLQMMKRITAENIHFKHIAINVSAIQLRELDFVEKLKGRLQFYDVSPSSLEIEVTESIIIDETEETIQKLIELKELGILIALDDFGTGYSSLNYLRMMPINRLKVDQSFIRGIEEDDSVQEIVNTIVTLGHNLGFQIVAEGVEEEEQLSILRNLNVDCIQGYYYSRPLDEETFLTFMHDSIDSTTITDS